MHIWQLHHDAQDMYFAITNFLFYKQHTNGKMVIQITISLSLSLSS